MKNIIQPLKTIVLALVIGLSIGYVMAWSAPTAPPPGANVPAPVNVGPSGGTTGGTQYKSNSFGVGGIFQTYSNTYLATNGGKVGIGTTNPTALLDVGSDATLEYQYQSTEAGLLGPRCDCDINTGSQDCPTSFSTTDATGSICYDQDTSSLNRSHKYLSIETVPAKHVTISANGDVVNDNFLLGGTYSDLAMRRLIDGDTTWKRALVAYPDKLVLNYSNDFSKGVETQGDMTVGDNIITGGTNSWIFHTPDDGRIALDIAPKTNGAWDWGNELQIKNNGDMWVNGDISVGGTAWLYGDISVSGKIDAGGVLQIEGTDKATWPTCTQSLAGQIRFNGTDQILICKYFSNHNAWAWGSFWVGYPSS